MAYKRREGVRGAYKRREGGGAYKRQFMVSVKHQTHRSREYSK